MPREQGWEMGKVGKMGKSSQDLGTGRSALLIKTKQNKAGGMADGK